MIPPEPEPDPPVPDVPVYTYSVHSTFADGSYTADFYQSIKDSNGNSCGLIVRREGAQNDDSLYQLAITDVTAFDQVNYYISNAAKSVAIYVDNAAVGGTYPYYSYDSVNSTWVQSGTAEVKSSVPADYFSIISSGVFSLTQRSSSKGDIDESSKYDD